MNFTPMSEKEIREINLIPEGIYDFKVVDAEEKISKKGNPMIEIKLIIWDLKGKERVLHDWLVSTSHFMFKIRHFCAATKLIDYYEKGELTAEHCINAQGKLKLIIQPDKGGQYDDKNAVQDYIVDKVTDDEPFPKIIKKAELVEPALDDDIPF